MSVWLGAATPDTLARDLAYLQIDLTDAEFRGYSRRLTAQVLLVQVADPLSRSWHRRIMAL